MVRSRYNAADHLTRAFVQLGDVVGGHASRVTLGADIRDVGARVPTYKIEGYLAQNFGNSSRWGKSSH
jgi:hypothetical protein